MPKRSRYMIPAASISSEGLLATWCPCTRWIDSSEPGVVRRFVAPVDANRFSQPDWPKVGTTSVFLPCHRPSMTVALMALLETFKGAPEAIQNLCVTLVGTTARSSERAIHVPRNSRLSCVSVHAADAIGDTRKTNRERVLLTRTPQLSSRSHSAVST